MATTHTRKLGTTSSIGPGETTVFRWNNPPWDTVLGYFAYPDPPAASGPHGSRTGAVEITRVVCTHLKDNDDVDKKWVEVHIKNTGSQATAAELWQSWID